MTLLVSDEEVRANLSMRDCIAGVERAFAAAGLGFMDLLERRVISAQGGARIHSLVAASQELGFLFSLIYSGTPAGQNKNTTTVNKRQKVFTLFDAGTGECAAILGGRYLSWLNTGAMGAVAINHLSDPAASSLAVVGSGNQARAAILGAVEVRELSDIRVVSRRRQRAEQLRADLADRVQVHVAGSVQEAVDGADIVVTATTSPSPVLYAEWLAPGAHVNTIGAHYPDRREVDTQTVTTSIVFVDALKTARAEKGELLLAQREGMFDFSQVRAELGAVVAGDTDWRRRPGERTLFCSCGSAVEAFGAAVAALEVVGRVDGMHFTF